MRIIVYLELIVVTLLWGLVPLVMKWSSQDLSAGSFNLLRYGTAVLFISLLTMPNLRRLKVPLTASLNIMLLGACSLFPFSYFFLLGVKLIPISVAGMIQGTAPALTIITTFIFFRRVPSIATVFGIIVTYVSLLLFLFVPDGTAVYASDWLGIAYVSIAILCFSIYTSLNKSFGGQFDNLVVTFYVSLGSFLASIPFVIYEESWLSSLHLTTSGMMGILYMSLFATVLSLVLYTKAVRSVGPLQASVFTNLIPLVIVASGVMFLHESVTLVQLLAAILTVFGIFLTIRSEVHVNRTPTRNSGKLESVISDCVASDQFLSEVSQRVKVKRSRATKCR